MLWSFITFSNGCKPHAVCEELAAHLRTDLAARGCNLEEERPLPRFGMDRGGACIRGRPGVEFEVDGLMIGFACDVLPDFYKQFTGAAPRRFAAPDGAANPYYKLHSHWNCLVLTPAQRDRLVALMAEALPVARAQAEAFYEQRG